MARILIAGCGDVGSALGVRLASHGHRVWGLRRQIDLLPAPIEPIAADLTRPATLEDLPGDLDHVVYTAAAAGRDDQAYRDAYVDGTRNLIAALVRDEQPVSRFLFTSSTGVYGHDDGAWVDESSATNPSRFTGRRLLEGEALVHAAPWTSIVLRLAGIYGPGRTRLIRRAQAAEPIRRHPPAYSNRIHRDDCAGAVAHVLGVDAPAACYVGVDHEPAPLADVVDWICQRQQWPLPPDDDATNEEGAAGRKGGNKRCRNTRLVDSGYTFRYPTYREGYAALLESSSRPPQRTPEQQP